MKSRLLRSVSLGTMKPSSAGEHLQCTCRFSCYECWLMITDSYSLFQRIALNCITGRLCSLLRGRTDLCWKLTGLVMSPVAPFPEGWTNSVWKLASELPMGSDWNWSPAGVLLLPAFTLPILLPWIPFSPSKSYSTRWTVTDSCFWGPSETMPSLFRACVVLSTLSLAWCQTLADEILLSFMHWNVSSLNAPWNLVALWEKPKPHGRVQWERNGAFSNASQRQLPTRCRSSVRWHHEQKNHWAKPRQPRGWQKIFK